MVLSPAFVGDNRRNFFRRAFGKLEKGSLSGSIFTLCASAIGSGVLALPQVLAVTGWVTGILLILNGALAALFSLRMIIEADVKANVKNFSLLAHKSGGKVLEKLL